MFVRDGDGARGWMVFSDCFLTNDEEGSRTSPLTGAIFFPCHVKAKSGLAEARSNGHPLQCEPIGITTVHVTFRTVHIAIVIVASLSGIYPEIDQLLTLLRVNLLLHISRPKISEKEG